MRILFLLYLAIYAPAGVQIFKVKEAIKNCELSLTQEGLKYEQEVISSFESLTEGLSKKIVQEEAFEEFNLKMNENETLVKAIYRESIFLFILNLNLIKHHSIDESGFSCLWEDDSYFFPLSEEKGSVFYSEFFTTIKYQGTNFHVAEVILLLNEQLECRKQYPKHHKIMWSLTPSGVFLFVNFLYNQDTVTATLQEIVSPEAVMEEPIEEPSSVMVEASEEMVKVSEEVAAPYGFDHVEELSGKKTVQLVPLLNNRKTWALWLNDEIMKWEIIINQENDRPLRFEWKVVTNKKVDKSLKHEFLGCEVEFLEYTKINPALDGFIATKPSKNLVAYYINMNETYYASESDKKLLPRLFQKNVFLDSEFAKRVLSDFILECITRNETSSLAILSLTHYFPKGCKFRDVSHNVDRAYIGADLFRTTFEGLFSHLRYEYIKVNKLEIIDKSFISCMLRSPDLKQLTIVIVTNHEAQNLQYLNQIQKGNILIFANWEMSKLVRQSFGTKPGEDRKRDFNELSNTAPIAIRLAVFKSLFGIYRTHTEEQDIVIHVDPDADESFHEFSFLNLKVVSSGFKGIVKEETPDCCCCTM